MARSIDDETPIIDDVLINIISRLPVKSLLRFKCVSKSWKSLISDPSLQVNLPTTISGLFCSFIVRGEGGCQYTFIADRGEGGCQYTFIADRSWPNTNNVAINDVDNLSFFPHHNHYSFSIVNCCNGLLLAEAIQSITSYTLAYYVINPATKKWAAVPQAPKVRTYTNCMLAFDPLVSPHYTLICWGLFTGVHIFSSKTGVWVHSKVPQELVTQSERHLFSALPAVLLNRALHMLSERDSIVGFDLDGECFQLIPLPGPMPSDLKKCLGVSGGYLYFANYDCSQLQIWMLKEYDEHKWVLKHQTTINSLVEKHLKHQTTINSLVEKHPQAIHFFSFHRQHRPSFEHYRNTFRFFAFHPDFEVLFFEMGGTLFSYHLNSMKLEEIPESMDNGMFYRQSLYPFSPCLTNFYIS